MIRILVEDLAFLEVDAVLRPANEVLDPITPGVSRMDTRAGARFERDRRVQSPLAVGAAVVTGAGDLAAKFVVHVVIQSPDWAASVDTIRRGLTSAWQRASDWQLARIAAPLVGTGAGGLTVEDSARLLASTFAQRLSPEFPSELTIVVERESEREAAEAVVRSLQRAGPNGGTSS